MTLTKIYTVVGFRVGVDELYRKLLRESPSFQEMIKKEYIDESDDFTYQDFYNLIVSGRYKYEETTDTEESMLDIMQESISRLKEYKYPNTSLSIYEITHDVADSDDWVIGVLVQTIQLYSKHQRETTIAQLLSDISYAERLLKTFNVKEYQVYQLQNDCTCCS